MIEKICHKCCERFKGEGIHCEKCSRYVALITELRNPAWCYDSCDQDLEYVPSDAGSKAADAIEELLASRYSVACEPLEHRSAAGELFGHLRESLKFGDLEMFTLMLGEAEQPSAMMYKLAFESNGKRYTCQECVSFFELEHLRSVEVFAQHLSDKWKHQCREVIPTEVE